MELADETIAATQQGVVCFRSRCRIRKGGSAGYIVIYGETSMGVRGFNGCPVDNETEQEKRQRARENAVPLDQL